MARPNPMVVDTPWYIYRQHRYSQMPPFRNALPYRVSRFGRRTRGTYLPKNTAASFLPEMVDPVRTAVANAVVVDVRSKIQEVALLLEDLAQARSLVNTLERRLFDTLRAAKRLRRGIYYSMQVMAGTRKRDSGRDERQLAQIPSAWLEFNFALKPTVLTADALIEHLRNADFSKRVSSYKSSPIGYVTGGANDRWAGYGSYARHSSGYVAITNPNAALAQAMGFASPFASAWALVPWSWAVDYFVDISAFLGNVDFRETGLTFRNWSTGTITRTSCVAKGVSLNGLGYAEDRFYSDVFSRDPASGPPLNYNLMVNPALNLRRCSYLASATALVLQGKMKP